MKRKPGLIGVLYAAILAAIAGYFFRTAQLSGGSSVPVVAFSVLMVLVFALAAVSLEKHAAYAEVYSPCRQDLAFSLLGAAGLIAGCALDFRGSVFRMLISLLGLLAGFGLGAAAVLRQKGQKPSAAFYVFAVLFYVAKLFRDFRHWEINPAIGDYCFYRSSLSSIKIPYSVTTVGAHCFEKCSMLETVELASTVTQLNEGCFSYCSSLTSLYFNGNMPDNTIGCGAPNSCSLYVPEEYYDHYQEELGAVYRKIFTWTPNELTRIDQLAQRDPQVSSQGGVVTVSGLNRGEEVQFVGLDGRLLSSVQALDGTASCAVSVPVVIARVRGAAVKVVVR